jgi:hypothetical protein
MFETVLNHYEGGRGAVCILRSSGLLPSGESGKRLGDGVLPVERSPRTISRPPRGSPEPRICLPLRPNGRIFHLLPPAPAQPMAPKLAAELFTTSVTLLAIAMITRVAIMPASNGWH